MHNKPNTTIADQERFRASVFGPPPLPHDFDEIDELVAADPILDHPPAKKGRSEIDRLMGILNEISVESGEG